MERSEVETLILAISGLRGDMIARMDGLRGDLIARMDGMENRINARFDKVESNLEVVRKQTALNSEEITGLSARISKFPSA